MPREDRKPLDRSDKSLEERVERVGPAAAASYTLVGAILVFGGLGYAIDTWRGTSQVFLMSGLALGIVVGFHALIKSVSKR